MGCMFGGGLLSLAFCCLMSALQFWIGAAPRVSLRACVRMGGFARQSARGVDAGPRQTCAGVFLCVFSLFLHKQHPGVAFLIMGSQKEVRHQWE